MKAISLRQPWAWLMATGFKDIEFRHRTSAFRGECYIHASKTWDEDGYQWLLKHPKLPGVFEVKESLWCPKSDPDFGAIIGKMNIVSSHPCQEALYLHPDNIWLRIVGRELGNYAFIVDNPELFSEDNYIPYKGKVAPLFFEVVLPVHPEKGV